MGALIQILKNKAPVRNSLILQYLLKCIGTLRAPYPSIDNELGEGEDIDCFLVRQGTLFENQRRPLYRLFWVS